MLGLNAVAAVNSGTAGSPVWVAQNYIKDLKIPLKMDKHESSTRGSGGIKTNEPTLLDITVTATCFYQPSDAQCATLLSDMVNRTAREWAFGDGPILTTGTRWIRAYCSTFGFEESQNLDENQVFDTEISPSSVVGTSFANASLNVS
jgi:hypothetical protein